MSREKVREMSNYVYIAGLDVSKDEIAVTVLKKGEREKISFVVDNDGPKFEKELKKRLPQLCVEDSLIVMEHTGVYHLRLAYYLYENGYNVAIINPLQIKRYAESKLSRAKTDRIDSGIIAEYGERTEEIRLFKPMEDEQMEIKIKLGQLEDLQVQLNILNNQKHALEYQPLVSVKELVKPYERVIEVIKLELKKIEKELKELVLGSYREVAELLTSIPGIGEKTASVIISYLKGFEDFNNAKAVASYIGLCPSVYESGKRVKKGRIIKRGNAYIRKMLYLCALSAKRFNKACKELFERLIQRGKTKKQALIAVANKLIRQAYAVLKSREKYNEELAMYGKKCLTN